MASTALAAAYAFTTTEEWVSTAYISSPRIEQITGYLEQRRELERADGNQTVDSDALANSLFNAFVGLSVAQKNKETFLARTEYVGRLLSETSSDAERQALLTHLAEKRLIIQAPKAGLINPYYIASFTADTPQAAQRVLLNYLKTINEAASKLVDAEFRDALQASIRARQAERDIIRHQLTAERNNRITTLEAALSTAQKAGLKEYSVGRNFDGNMIVELSNSPRLFMLGERYLTAELQTAKESPIIYPARYYDIERILGLLEPTSAYLATPVLSYRYQLEPTFPLEREAPKRMLIVTLGLLLGGMLGCGWVLIGEAMRTREQAAPSDKAVIAAHVQ